MPNTYYCPVDLKHGPLGFPTVKEMEEHVLTAHPEYPYDQERIDEPPTAEDE